MKNSGIIIEKANLLGCHVQTDELLKNHTTFQVGGKCDALIHINCAENCRILTGLCREHGVPFFIFGKGSNLIVDDSGLDGIVFLMGNEFSGAVLLDETRLVCDAGTSLAAACLYAYENGLSGLEFAWGIPGTVGGAVYMNAGAYGGEVCNVIESVEYIDKNGNICTAVKDNMDFSYRHSRFSDGNEIILRAVFSLEKGEKAAIKAKMDELMQRRKDKQPLEFPSAGSTFKRPEGNYASLLIEQCGLKGLCVGGARVSEKHSGFVINAGGATCADILALIQKVQETVKEKTGYTLECEPKILLNKLQSMGQ